MSINQSVGSGKGTNKWLLLEGKSQLVSVVIMEKYESSLVLYDCVYTIHTDLGLLPIRQVSLQILLDCTHSCACSLGYQSSQCKMNWMNRKLEQSLWFTAVCR